MCNKPPQTSVVGNNNHFLTFTGVRWVGNSGRVWPSGSSALQGAGWGHSLGCVHTVVGMGKEVPGGFIHASAASMLLHVTPPPLLSLPHRLPIWLAWASLQHGSSRSASLRGSWLPRKNVPARESRSCGSQGSASGVYTASLMPQRIKTSPRGSPDSKGGREIDSTS